MAGLTGQRRRAEQHRLAIDRKRRLHRNERAGQRRLPFAEARSEQRIERLRHAAAFDQPGAEAGKSTIAGQ